MVLKYLILEFVSFKVFDNYFETIILLINYFEKMILHLQAISKSVFAYINSSTIIDYKFSIMMSPTLRAKY